MRDVRIVLVRPRRAENLGAIARAMKNFGLSDWVAVQPPSLDRVAAKLVATGARELVDALQVAPSLDEAVADCVWVLGTGSRPLRGARRMGPREAAALAVERLADGPVCFVFGEESSGLTRKELERMHDLSTLPTDAAQPSLNLAQAVMLYCHEYRQAQLDKAPRSPPALPVAATDGDLVRLEARLEQVLALAAVLRPGGEGLGRELLAPLRRGRLSRRESAKWEAALGGLHRALAGDTRR